MDIENFKAKKHFKVDSHYFFSLIEYYPSFSIYPLQLGEPAAIVFELFVLGELFIIQT
jgi:hypothetical protein